MSQTVEEMKRKLRHYESLFTARGDLRCAPQMDPRVVAAAEKAAESYLTTFASQIEYAGGHDPKHMARFVASYLGAAGFIRKRRDSDCDNEPDLDAVKDRCGPAVLVDSAQIEDRKPEEAQA